MSNQIINQPPTLDSREVAEMIGKRHADLIRSIENYINILLNAKLRSADFFIESAYKDASGKMNKRYEITKMGCEMVANKLTGKKGILFTAAYVKKFNDMERGNQPTKSAVPDAIRSKEAEAKLMNARARVARQYHKMLDEFSDVLSPIAQQAMLSLEANTLAGCELIPAPQAEPKYYSAEDLGKPIGWSKQKVGRFSNANDLKQERYGKFLMSKSQYGPKQVTTFVYNEAGRRRFYELAGRPEMIGDA